MPSKPTPRIAPIRRWVALSTVIVFLSVWLAVLTLGKGGLATSTSTSTTASNTPASTSIATDTSSAAVTSSDDSSQEQTPSLDTSQS